MLIGFVLKFRYVAVVAVVLLLAHALALLGLACWRTYEAYLAVTQGGGEGHARPGIPIAESVDAALFALVLIVLAFGTASLYLGPGDGPDPRVPAWMRVRNLSELKTLLWEGILLVLVVAALTTIMANTDNMTWDLLILPAAVLVLAAGLFLKTKVE